MRNFQGYFSRTKVIFQDFPGPGILKKKIQDFPGVGTLVSFLKLESVVVIVLYGSH